MESQPQNPEFRINPENSPMHFFMSIRAPLLFLFLQLHSNCMKCVGFMAPKLVFELSIHLS